MLQERLESIKSLVLIEYRQWSFSRLLRVFLEHFLNVFNDIADTGKCIPEGRCLNFLLS